MNAATPFDQFTRSAFGIEPGGTIGARLKAMATQAALPKGQSAPSDRTTDQVVFLASGATKLSAHASLEREQIVAFHFGGDITAIPSDSIYAYELTALVDSELLLFPAREFFDLAASDASISRSLLGRLTAALYRSRDKAVALGQKSASERLAGFLLGMSERVGKPHRGGCLLDLPMSRRDIGDSLGLTIETVSRQISHLREAGLVETQGRSHVRLLDLEALMAMAGHAQPAKNSTDNDSNLISINARLATSG